MADEPDYRVYRSGAATQAGRRSGKRPDDRAGDRPSDRASARPDVPSRRAGRAGERPYTTYRSQPRSLVARLRGETDPELEEERAELLRRRGDDPREPRPRRTLRTGWTWRRVLKYVVLAVVAWVALSTVLFFVSAEDHAGNLPAGADSQLTSAGPMLFSPNTVLILGLDNRPTTGLGSKEPGSNYSEKVANTDSIMLWRIGGGVSRRLSIPRDTLVNVPGYGQEKINAAWSEGGPALTLKVIKQFTGLQINHLIVVDLANFPKFIDDIGGVTVTTPKICSNISGGAADGGFTLNLAAGSHHLTGEQALILARTRENSCDPAYNDLNREAAQQQILNGIKSQLLSVHAFLHLPWAAWDAPGVIQTDMGGLTLMQLFLSSEIGGSAPPALLKETGSVYNGQDVLLPNQGNVASSVQKFLHGG
jgi:LCP family protein required for cell wall assembly